MNSARDMLLSDSRELLERVIENASGLDTTDRCFAEWFLGVARCPSNLCTPFDTVAEQRTQGYREVAAFGYAAEAKAPASNHASELCEALTWLSNRPMTLSGQPAGFVCDGAALLGVALGAVRCGSQPVTATVVGWMRRVLEARTQLPALEPWEMCLLAAAEHRLDLRDHASVPTSDETADCRVALRARGVLPQVYRAHQNADESSLIEHMLTENLGELCFSRAVIRAAAYDALKAGAAVAGRTGTFPLTATEPGRGAPSLSPKKVFVSYSWEPDSPEHQKRVLHFTNELRRYGFDATMDLFEPNPPEGLPQWMLGQIRRADFVLMVITEAYRRRCEGDEAPGRGKGVKWEGGIVTRSIYQDEFQQRKFIPVLFDAEQTESIPTILVGNTYYHVGRPQGMEELVRLMSDQPAYLPAPIGTTPTLRPKDAG